MLYLDFGTSGLYTLLGFLALLFIGIALFSYRGERYRTISDYVRGGVNRIHENINSGK